MNSRARIASRPASGRGGQVMFLIGLGILALIFGFIASLGNPLIVLFLAAIFLSVALIASPIALLWVVIVGGLIVSGVAELHFPAIAQARWGVVIAALALGIVSLFSRLLRYKPDTGAAPLHQWAIFGWAGLFFLTTTLSAFVNLGLTTDLITGLKGYFQVWGILVAFALLPLKPASADRIMAFLVIVGLIQLPFILHQHFVLVPERFALAKAYPGLVPQDILVGTFSGSMTGGGAGPAMAILLLTTLSMVAAMWRGGMLSGLATAIMAIVFIAPLAIGEHKIALVLIPVGMIIVFVDQVRGNLLKVAGLMAAAIPLLAILFVAFTMLPRAGTTQVQTPSEYLDEMLSYNVGEQGYGNLALNRTTVYPFWARQHQSGGGTLVNTLIGYGPGASKDSKGSYTEHSLATERFAGYGIGLTGISGLLWDVGVLGTVAALGFLVATYRTAHALATEVPAKSQRWVYLKAAEAGLAMMVINLFHNNMFVFDIGFQTLMMILVGYVVFVLRAGVVARNTTRATAHA